MLNITGFLAMATTGLLGLLCNDYLFDQNQTKTVDMRTRDLVLYCAGAGSRGLYIRNQYCGK